MSLQWDQKARTTVPNQDIQPSQRAVQPARGEPVQGECLPLDWGDEEPDQVWEALYIKGLVHPPYRGRGNLAEVLKDWKPVGVELSDKELMQLLGRNP